MRSGEEGNSSYQTDRTFQKVNGKHPQKPHTNSEQTEDFQVKGMDSWLYKHSGSQDSLLLNQWTKNVFQNSHTLEGSSSGTVFLRHCEAIRVKLRYFVCFSYCILLPDLDLNFPICRMENKLLGFRLGPQVCFAQIPIGNFIPSKWMPVTLHIHTTFHQDPCAGLRPLSCGPTLLTYAYLSSGNLSKEVRA